eukprot:7378737-Prorocentrum_lima.AAC.1
MANEARPTRSSRRKGHPEISDRSPVLFLIDVAGMAIATGEQEAGEEYQYTASDIECANDLLHSY